MATVDGTGASNGGQHDRVYGVREVARDDTLDRALKQDQRGDRKRKHNDARDHDTSKRRRTQSRSPDRKDEYKERDRPRDRDRDRIDRDRDRMDRDRAQRDRERDQGVSYDRKVREPPTGPRARPTAPKGSGGRGPRAIPTRHDEEMDVDRPEPRGRPPAPSQGSRKARVGPLSAPFIPDIDVEEDDQLLMDVQKVMGFAGFKSTNNRKVPGNKANFAVRKEKQTQYRQYMNRVGGFNRPLSPSRE